MALCATTALAGAVSRQCVRGARGRFGGGSGRYLVLCLSCFPLPAPRVPRCVWRAVPSGCPLPSLAGTPFHAVCAFRALGPVALPVVPACPFRVCALALSRCPPPPPAGWCGARVSLHYGQSCPPEWDDGSVPAETADRQKKKEHGKSNLHAEEDFLQGIKTLDLDPRLKKLLLTYKEVFGALPPPLSCKKLVQMDLKLKPEFEKT